MGSCLLLVAVWQSFVAVRGLALALKAGEPAAQGRRKSKKLTLIRSRLVGADWGGRGLRPERVQDWILSTPYPIPIFMVQEMEGLVGGDREEPRVGNGYQLGCSRSEDLLGDPASGREGPEKGTARKQPDSCRATGGCRNRWPWGWRTPGGV